MLTPKQIVDALDRYIIGQEDAKRAVAIALRNRYRRSRLSPELREEITPKNIILLGPTGVGKTEIARRLAKLVDAPFIKVEATKFTEVGYVGRDVESIIRDLVEESVRLTKKIHMERVRGAAEAAARQRLLDLLLPQAKKQRQQTHPLQLLLGSGTAQTEEAPKLTEEEQQAHRSLRELTAQRLDAGLLEQEQIEIEVEESSGTPMIAMGVDLDLGNVLGDMLPKRRKLKRMPVHHAWEILIAQESEKRIDMDEVHRAAIANAEQNGIVFLDEIDKIAGNHNHSGADVSREGVQRDILPIVEGTTVATKYGSIKTDFILFIGAGAFHVSSVSDLIPELQGRFPIRVRLNDLTEEDFYRILTQPDNAITKQYAALLEPDCVRLTFTEDALLEIAKFAYRANEQNENIGARRLHTVMENLLNDISFNANGNHPMIDLCIDGDYVDAHLSNEWSEDHIHKYIL